MSVELKDWIDFVKAYAMSYVVWFFGVLGKPWAISAANFRKGIPAEHAARTNRIDIPIALLLSAFLGATLGAVIPGRPPLQDRVTVFVVVILVWLFIGWLIHCVCRLLRGKGTLAATMSAVVQVLAVAYVLSNFLTLLVVTAGNTYPVVADAISDTPPGNIIIYVQCIALIYLIPASIGGLHAFRALALVVVAIVSAAFALLISLPVAASGGCYGPESLTIGMLRHATA